MNKSRKKRLYNKRIEITSRVAVSEFKDDASDGQPNFFRFKKLENKVLITNDFGGHYFLDQENFDRFKDGEIEKGDDYYRGLAREGFLKTEFNVDDAVNLYRLRNASIFRGTSLHIMVVTLRCNYGCVYCQASSRPMEADHYDMDIETAKKTIDFILSTPNPEITIEFQGGEPLVNWPVIKFVVEYVSEKVIETGKKVFLSVVTNMSLMDEDRLKFLVDNNVGLCTSLDGPEWLHNLNRPLKGGNSYEETTKWIKRIKEIEAQAEEEGRAMYHLSALLTVSRHSLKYPKEIIDEYLKWGFNGIHLRALTYMGAAGITRDKIGYSIDEFMEFWKTSMDYIIELNLSGTDFIERGTTTILNKVLRALDPCYVDLKSPCGAAIDQMLYNYDGKIYTCDEGRMYNNETFVLGGLEEAKDSNGYAEDYQKIMSGDKVKAMIVSSTLDNGPCDYCVYKPYCGVCPVINYAASHGNLNPQILNTGWCKRHMAMFDYIFEKMQDQKVLSVFKKWVGMQ